MGQQAIVAILITMLSVFVIFSGSRSGLGAVMFFNFGC